MSAVQFSATLNTAQLQSALTASNQQVGAWARGVEGQVSGVDSAMNKLGAGLAVYFGAGKLKEFGMEVINVRGQFQQLGIAFETMLGSKDKADKLMNEAVTFAAKTPFTLADVATNIKQLMAMGIATENVMGTMKALGDVAAGVSVPISRVAINYGQVAVMGKLQGRELRDFAMAGIPLVDELAKNMGKSKDEIQGMVTAGQIGFPLVEAAFKSMSGEGGRFYNLMEKQNASVTGQISNLTDKWQVMLNDIGKANEGLIYSGISGIASLITNYKTVGEVFGGLITVFGAYKLAVMLVAREQTLMAASTAIAASSNGVLTLSEARLWAVEERRLATNEALNKSMLANPYVLAAMAVAALSYAVYKLVTYETDLEKSINKSNVEISNETDKADELFAAMGLAKEGTDAWKKAKDAIISQYGSYLTGQQSELLGTKDQAIAQQAVNDGIRENIQLKIRDQSITEIGKNTSTTISDYIGGTKEQIKNKFGAEEAAKFEMQIQPLIYNVKFAIDKTERAKAYAELDEFVKKTQTPLFKGQWIQNNMIGTLKSVLVNYNAQVDAVKNAFDVTAKVNESVKQKPEYINTEQQRIKLRGDLVIAEKELVSLQTKQFDKTKGEDPLKAIADQEAVIKGLKDQLGIKEEKTKKEVDQEKQILEAMKTATGEKLKLLAAELVALQKINEAKQKTIDLAIFEAKYSSKAELDYIDMYSGQTVKTKDPTKYKKQDTIDDARKSIETNNKKIDKILESEKEKAKQLAGNFYEVADAANQLSQSIGDSNSGLADMLSGVGKVAEDIGNLVKAGAFTSKGMTKDNAINAAISGASQLIGIVAGQVSENKRVMDEYYANIISQQQEYNLLLNDQLRINSDIHGSVFLKDYEGSLNDATLAYNDAQKKYQEESKKFFSSEAIVGKKNVISGGNVLGGIGAGVALGAGIGSIVPVIGTVIGAAVGGVVGALTGLFAKKKKDIVAPLLETYPDLIKANGEFNADLAKTLVANNKVTEATKQTLQNLIDWKDAADKATEQLKSVVSELTGSLGNGLRDALVGAFVDGTDAAMAFKGEVNKVLENIMSNMIFNKAFEGAFKTLEDNMVASYAVTGDQTWLDDFQKFYDESPELINQFNKGMADAKQAGADAGFNIFDSASISNPALTGSSILRQITEETPGEFVGLMRRQADDTTAVRSISQLGVDHLINIEKNTADTVSELKNAVIELKAINGNTKVTYHATI